MVFGLFFVLKVFLNSWPMRIAVHMIVVESIYCDRGITWWSMAYLLDSRRNCYSVAPVFCTFGILYYYYLSHGLYSPSPGVRQFVLPPSYSGKRLFIVKFYRRTTTCVYVRAPRYRTRCGAVVWFTNTVESDNKTVENNILKHIYSSSEFARILQRHASLGSFII